ncbi:hypothetical protein A3H85_02070 [Candidatus Daviesbacteria bacterium RIFCSPLOWO2_02_FULL_40_8]|uniref:Uncharacterized protein n=1 Tax=Candidatus Daviesbacteria bacterium RIFCSPLOWO2_01_FULL_40_24 TaxID=1797787 RepID=A0A1F5MJL6_9BACT|nr:MAG: hypothetical protein A2780_02910 [Candidatus Daviesbacteria bacterium RIFCSPHIGHO2_01_FULL_41_45]OGE35486.1 MAG: hypothetical protein A3C32_03485 [Candidatus Daviesbacteria bacterium RIFCSPHIGHO2_02_FULL_41_14]OGE65576.1 MAG: hypothetical protein A3B49_02065 [Candidatus Daviesbacteria bacterium RIFCSPLOWO2_01_FULL_40_24]OGE67137.1 MAG: hypothetical protein A3H85_02070 [Candidatus Daviesbacteria bacterium RIFCSPLOWO2_02_FULL_40_8]
MNNKFLEYIQGDQKILVISSDPLDLDCLGSGLVLKKYLESLNKEVMLMFPRKLTEQEKQANNFLPYFDEIIEQDSREILSKRNADTLIFLDGSSLTQYYDTDETKENPPNLEIYPKRIHIDHHSSRTEELGKLIIHDPQASSTMEVLLDQVVNPSFLDDKTATLAYVAIMGDTGNFQWAFTDKTLMLAAKLIQLGADNKTLIHKMFSSKSKDYLFLLSWIIQNLEFSDEVKTIFLDLSFEQIKKSGFNEDQQKMIKNIFNSEISTSIEGYDRGIVLREKNHGRVSVSCRGSKNNLINLPEELSKIGGIGGGHFNACGFEFQGKSTGEVKKDIIEAFKK